MSDEPAGHGPLRRCPGCGAVLGREPGAAGRTAQAIDALHREVSRLTQIAELRQAADDAELDRRAAREAALVEEIRQLRATVARLRATSRATGT